MRLKKALFTLTFINLLIATLLSILIFWLCLEIRSQIAPHGVVIDTGTLPVTMAPLPAPSARASALARVLDALQYVLPVLVFIGASFSTAIWFYRLKLKKPVAILTSGANRIIANDLDFTVETDATDELGQLCIAFETMRQALVANHQELWRHAEERKRLNAAFSHELRNPVTVLKGAAKLANQSIENGTASPEQLSKNLQRMEGYARRIEDYVEVMSSVQRLEQIPLAIKTVRWDALMAELAQTARLVGMDSGKDVVFEAHGGADVISADMSILLQVVENLVSNALRFAKRTIHVLCTVRADMLELSVADDGEGFPPALLQKGVQPFQKGNDETAHFGMGLYMCTVLCQKHGGGLEIHNMCPGALVRATVKMQSSL